MDKISSYFKESIMANIPNAVKARARQHGIECNSFHFTFKGYLSFAAKHLILFNCDKCLDTLAAKMKDTTQELTGSFSR